MSYVLVGGNSTPPEGGSDSAKSHPARQDAGVRCAVRGASNSRSRREPARICLVQIASLGRASIAPRWKHLVRGAPAAGHRPHNA